MRRGFSVSAKQDAPQHSSKAILTLHSAFTDFLGMCRGFFLDEIEIPERDNDIRDKLIWVLAHK